MSKAIPKAQLMRELRARRKNDDLVEVRSYVKPEDKERLAKYVTGTLKGVCNVKPLDK